MDPDHLHQLQAAPSSHSTGECRCEVLGGGLRPLLPLGRQLRVTAVQDDSAVLACHRNDSLSDSVLRLHGAFQRRPRLQVCLNCWAALLRAWHQQWAGHPVELGRGVQGSWEPGDGTNIGRWWRGHQSCCAAEARLDALGVCSKTCGEFFL
jgi:hypothetical protein